MWKKVAEIIKHFQELQLTDVEIACFFILTMGQSIIQHSIKPRETRKSVSFLFNEVFKGLNKYYQENYKSFEFAIRMGQILTFLPLFTEMDAIMNEHFHQLRLCSTEKNRKSFVFFDPEMETSLNKFKVAYI
uniref:NR LBD domain-containing protein n=1 Tax=Panagrolaimus davidi TaxID=227884 RepID=A0A914QT17_9BILA